MVERCGLHLLFLIGLVRVSFLFFNPLRPHRLTCLAPVWGYSGPLWRLLPEPPHHAQLIGEGDDRNEAENTKNIMKTNTHSQQTDTKTQDQETELKAPSRSDLLKQNTPAWTVEMDGVPVGKLHGTYQQACDTISALRMQNVTISAK